MSIGYVPADPEFAVRRRGSARERILDWFRVGLLGRTNPQTGQPFTQDEVARATAKGSRWSNEASAIDDIDQGTQRKALFLAQQLNPLTANTWWLEHVWGPQWTPDGRLTPGRAGGRVTITAPSGTTIVGSTTIPDETAHWGYVGSVRVQILVGGTVPSSGSISVPCVAIDAGTQGNFVGDETLQWSNRDPAMPPTVTLSSAWSGGTDLETDYEWAVRIVDAMRYKQGGGNSAQQRAWAKRATSSVLEAFVYPCFGHANSFLVAVMQKRSEADTSYDALQPNEATLAEVTAAVVPPGSYDQPALPFVLVTGFTQVNATLAVHVDMPSGSSDGFLDVGPWPTHTTDDGLPPRITAVGASSFTITSADDDYLPGQTSHVTITSGFPELMIWDRSDSMWRAVTGITSIADSGGGVFVVNVNAVQSWMVSGAFVSPGINAFNAAAASQALRDYFDSRGPGELVSNTDIRSARCIRFPETISEYPSSADDGIASAVRDAIGGVVSRAIVPYLPTTSAGIPSDPSGGPRKLVLYNAAIYPLD